MDERWQKLIAALAEYFGCEPDDVTEFVVGVEYRSENELNFRTAYVGVPWHFNGLLDQVKDDIAKDKRS
jgi:hypothetical protein